MDREQEKIESFSRRAFIVGGFQGLAVSILGVRLSWLQIVEGEKYKSLADNNRISSKILAPMRGQIVDRFGVPLAINNQNFQVLIVPEQVEDIETELRKLQRVISLNDASIAKVVKQLKRNPSYVPIEVRDHLAWDEVAQVELNLPKLSGVSIESAEERSYPYQDSTAHVIGYVGRVSEKDMTDDPLLSMPGFQIGKSGIEKQYESILRGKSGRSDIEVNVHGRAVRELDRTSSQSGERLTLSIDAEYQRFVQQRLSTERSAAAIVMDCITGEVYSLASHPSFNPNLFAAGISTMDWEQLRDDIAHPLNNKVTGGLYPPGSTFKIVTALAGLKSGVINEHSTEFCPGHYDFGKNRFHCWKHEGHGTVNVVKALSQSCDTFFYKICTRIGIEKIAEMAKTLGFGSTNDFDIPEVKEGLVPTPEWKKRERKEVWHPGETINVSIGQGYMLASPLQMATMLSRVVGGGYNVKPWVGGYMNDQKIPRETPEKLDIDPKHLSIVMQGLVEVLEPGGTAYGSRIEDEGLEMGGKTGTSQVKRITAAERAKGVRKQSDLPWELRHHALFVGYAPIHNPRYACAVIVEHGESGSGAAAPIARDILLEIQKRNPAAKGMSAT